MAEVGKKIDFSWGPKTRKTAGIFVSLISLRSSFGFGILFLVDRQDKIKFSVAACLNISITKLRSRNMLRIKLVKLSW